MLEITWPEIKTFLIDRSLSANYVEFTDMYIITGVDGYLSFFCKLRKDNSTDQTDFETNFKPDGNKTLQPKDVDNTNLSRTKITKTGWHFQLHGMEMTTGLLNGVYNKDKNGNDLGFAVIKFYDINDLELTTQVNIDASCVKTVITWEPTEDIEVIGGILEQAAAPNTNVRMWITAIPDVPLVYGGNVPFTNGGINLRYLPNTLDLDGKTPKELKYDNVNHTNKFEITLKHDAGVQHTLLLLFKLFRLNV
jgi:hypothetical protein